MPSYGIYFLTLVAGGLLVIFKGVTDRLIPLYAIGAFLAFTLSQSGMVAHWRRLQGRHFLSMFLNGLGAVTTALIPVLFVVMKAVHRQYALVEKEIELHEPMSFEHLAKPLVIVPITGWNRITEKALRFAFESPQRFTPFTSMPRRMSATIFSTHGKSSCKLRPCVQGFLHRN